MKFQLTAKVDKQLWTNNTDAWLYLVEETFNDKTKKWTVFCDSELAQNAVYNFEGYVTETKDKKKKDQDGKDIYRATFNANKITDASDVPF